MFIDDDLVGDTLTDILRANYTNIIMGDQRIACTFVYTHYKDEDIPGISLIQLKESHDGATKIDSDNMAYSLAVLSFKNRRSVDTFIKWLVAFKDQQFPIDPPVVEGI